MKMVTRYTCSICGIDYATESDAQKCEASVLEPFPFTVNQKVYYTGSGSDWETRICELRVDGTAGKHQLVARVGANEDGSAIWTTASWLKLVDETVRNLVDGLNKKFSIDARSASRNALVFVYAEKAEGPVRIDVRAPLTIAQAEAFLRCAAELGLCDPAKEV